MLASASYDETVRLWDLTTNSELALLTGTEEQPLAESYAVAFSPDGAILASGHADGTIALWDAASKTLRTRMGSQIGEIRDLAFSPDGTQLVTTSTQPAVQLWDVATGTEVMAAVGHTDYMSVAVFSPDSSTLALTDWSNNIWLWDTASLQQLNSVTPTLGTLATSAETVNLVGYAPDGSLLATSDGFEVALFDPATHTEVRRLSDCVGTTESFAFSPDSSLLATASSDGMCLFNVETGELLASFAAGDWANSVVFSPDQTMIAIASKDHTVRVYGLPQ
jgi:WD40 repeat protein